MGEESARLRIVQITDVYTLKNFPHLKTLLNEKRAEIDKLGGKTISMLTGDFLAPYLLSSFDKGKVIIYKSCSGEPFHCREYEIWAFGSAANFGLGHKVCYFWGHFFIFSWAKKI